MGRQSVQLRQGDLVRRPPICTPPNQRASREKIATASEVFLPEELRAPDLMFFLPVADFLEWNPIAPAGDGKSQSGGCKNREPPGLLSQRTTPTWEPIGKKCRPAKVWYSRSGARPRLLRFEDCQPIVPANVRPGRPGLLQTAHYPYMGQTISKKLVSPAQAGKARLAIDSALHLVRHQPPIAA